MRTWLIAVMIFSVGALLLPMADAGKKTKDEEKEVKEALGALQEFIGNWKNGNAVHKKEGTWTEKSNWS